MKNKIKNVFDVLIMNTWWQKTSSELYSKLITSLVFAVAALAMLILNYFNHSMLMFDVSLFLVIGFLISAFSAGVLKNIKLTNIVISILVCGALSIFALSGGNNGFAILWILLVPVLAVNVIGVIRGFATACYFLIFIFVLFYTPLRFIIEDKYTPEFIQRFPVLYFSDFVLSIFLSFQKEYFSRVVHLKSYTDDMTKCYNRRFYNENFQKYADNKNFCMILIDVNGLKKVNDTLGHEAGDELICGVSQCCKKVFDSKNSSLCRIGGDEFVILFNGTPDEADKLITQYRAVCSEWKGELVSKLSSAVGFASLNSESGMRAEDLYRMADEQMYIDKTKYYDSLNNQSHS